MASLQSPDAEESWLDSAWALSQVLILVVTSVLIIVEVSRSRDGSGEYLYYRASLGSCGRS